MKSAVHAALVAEMLYLECTNILVSSVNMLCLLHEDKSIAMAI